MARIQRITIQKKNLNDWDNDNGVTTHHETDILDCEVKCALESITTNKARGGDGIPAELFQILKEISPVYSMEGLMLKLPHNCTYFTCQQGDVQNPPS